MNNRALVLLSVLAVLLTTTVCFAVAQDINALFPPVASLNEEDEMDLRGMEYNETQVCDTACDCFNSVY